jgi:hypothetical protein
VQMAPAWSPPREAERPDMLIFATFFASPNIQASHLPARGGRNSRSGLHGLFHLYCSLYGVLASLGWYSHPRLYVSLAILPVCQTCAHFQSWSAFGPKHGITDLGYTRLLGYQCADGCRILAYPLSLRREIDLMLVGVGMGVSTG